MIDLLFFNVCLDALSVVGLNDMHPFNSALPFTKLKYKVLYLETLDGTG